MNCPKCDEEMKLEDVLHGDEVMYQMWECPNCGEEFENTPDLYEE
ncbi:MAG: hypothetical protein ACOCVF_02945 [bacterium]